MHSAALSEVGMEVQTHPCFWQHCRWQVDSRSVSLLLGWTHMAHSNLEQYLKCVLCTAGIPATRQRLIRRRRRRRVRLRTRGV